MHFLVRKVFVSLTCSLEFDSRKFAKKVDKELTTSRHAKEIKSYTDIECRNRADADTFSIRPWRKLHIL